LKPKTPARPTQLSALRIFPIIFFAVLLLHAPLLHLPFFWDEAGYYVPAAHDLAQYHTVIVKTTIDAGHPPLSAAYLAFWFTLAGWKPVVARIAMLLLAAFALTNVFLLARRVSKLGVAIAATVATAVYPIFFAQSSLAHADLAAAAFTLWGVRLGIERRMGWSQFALSLAVLSKETAIITPAALAFWEMFFAKDADDNSAMGRMRRSAVRLVPALPFAAWLIFHYHAIGHLFGDAEFIRYNVTQTLSPLRFVFALALRTWHLFGIMNMLALTAATLVAMFFPPVTDDSGERPRIAVPVQTQFALIMLVHIVTFSIVGGAELTRYLLPAYPLVIIIAMSTLHRRILRWEWPAAIMVIFFVLALFFDPPYKFAPEDNLTYKDFVELHAEAARFLEQNERGATVLTAWPASDELKRPYLGYVSSPIATLPIDNFTLDELLKVRRMRGQFQVAYLFSTKYESTGWIRSKVWDKLNRQFFDDHQDLPPDLAAQLLGGRVVFHAERKHEWVEIIEMQPRDGRPVESLLHEPRDAGH
jgi:4-amino-4-deoxy-L-arabinose transferase-like glycosyltransferase